MSPRALLLTTFLAILLLAATLTLKAHSSICSLSRVYDHDLQTSIASNDATGRKHSKDKVPLEIHIMSQCPDAKDCLEMLIAPAMEKIDDIVDFKMSFIGRPTESGISCMHGPSECLGNTLHLCAMHVYPSPSDFLPFSLCLTHNYTHITDRSFIESCAKQHDLSFDKLNECISSIEPDGGYELLKKSVERSRELDAETSCTVRVDEEVWCVRDGGKWKRCDDGAKPKDLVSKVRELYKQEKSETEGRGPGLLKQVGGRLWARL